MKTKYVFKKTHTRKYYDKVSEDSKKEKIRYQKKKERVERERERQRLKSEKEKVPPTEEEKKARAKENYERVKKEGEEIDKKIYIPITRIEVMRRIRKIYARGGIEELASDTGICEHWFKSWMETNQRPEGGYLKDLQEYFVKH